MWCIKCNHDLGECVCPDLQQRLASLNNVPNFVYRSCKHCKQHYSQCKCVQPEWELTGQVLEKK